MNEIEQLKAENDNLKNKLSEAEAIILAYKEEKEDWMLRCAEKDNDIEILVSENVKLKQQLAEIGKSWDEIQRLKRENEKLNKITSIFSARLCEKYHTTLQEIKAIAEDAKRDICNNCGWRNTESCDPEDYTCGEFIKILQKITEAEEE